MDEARIEIEAVGDSVHVRISGDLTLQTISTHAALRDPLAGIADDAPERVVLDLRGLTMIDSSGLATLLRSNARALRTGRRLVVVRPPPAIQRMLELVHTDRYLHMVDDPAAEPGDEPQRFSRGD